MKKITFAIKRYGFEHSDECGNHEHLEATYYVGTEFKGRIEYCIDCGSAHTRSVPKEIEKIIMSVFDKYENGNKIEKTVVVN